MNTEEQNAKNAGGSNGNGAHKHTPIEMPRIITRRSAIAGGMSALALGVLGAKKAAGQTVGSPLALAGGLCQGRIVRMGVADATTWMQSKLSSNSNFEFVYNHFTAQGFSFILQRSKVYVYMAYGATTSSPAITPGIVGIVPSFVQFSQAAPSHTAVGIGVSDSGFIGIGSVVVNHNPYFISQFTVYDLIPGTPPVLQPHTITGADLQNMTPCQAADVLGTPSFPDLSPSSLAAFTEPDGSGLLSLTYQSFLGDSYAAPLYPPSGFQSMINQTPLVLMFGNAVYQRMTNALAGVSLSIGCSKFGTCTTCSNCCTTCTATCCSGSKVSAA